MIINKIGAMPKKKGLTFDEKKKRLLEVFYEKVKQLLIIIERCDELEGVRKVRREERNK